MLLNPGVQYPIYRLAIIGAGILTILLLWLLAERGRRRKTFEKQAQEVLEEKFEAGEINQKTFDKYRQDVTLRPKR